jgi:hypothetical protein
MKISNLKWTLLVLVSLIIFSCGKDSQNPTIEFVPNQEFSGRDTMIKVNYTLTVTLEVNWNGVDVLSELEVLRNDVSIYTYPVSGESAVVSFNLQKGSDDSEKWTFIIRDVKGNNSDIHITLTKDPSSEFGAIDYYNSVVMGAQNNTVRDGFISFQTFPATTYTLEGGFTNPAKIDLLYYSDLLTLATLASPGSGIPEALYAGPRNVILWSTLNVSKFLKSEMTVQNFNEISNDAPIVNSWVETQSLIKATELKTNDVWLIKLQSGKKAAILVKNIVPGDKGEIEYAIKIQK